MRVACRVCVRAAVLVTLLCVPIGSGLRTAASPPAVTGQTATLLPDGRWLLLGGEGSGGALDTATVWDPRTGVPTPLPRDLHHRRAWHSATVLPDGSVLVMGGLRNGGVVQSMERIGPDLSTVEDLGPVGPAARAGHTATLLTDGRILVAGGHAAGGDLVEELQVWIPRTGEVLVVGRASVGRSRHAASLLASGHVLFWGGYDAAGNPLTTADQYDPSAQTVTAMLAPPGPDVGAPALAASLPPDGATAVPTTSIVALRFSRPIDPARVTEQSVFLTGPGGPEAARAVTAEGGRLVFLTPGGLLEPAVRYTVTLSGVADPAGAFVPFTVVAFQTAGSPMAGTPGGPPAAPSSAPADADPASDRDDEIWSPPGSQDRPDWRHGSPPTQWQRLAQLEAEAGITALAGQVLRLNGTPLPGVTLAIGARQTRTDATGRFLLRGAPAGRQVVLIDGRSANRPGLTYGVFEVGVEVADGRTTVLPYTVWMPRLDTAHAVAIPSPTTDELVVTTPRIPGLELRIPPGTVIRDHEGKIVRELSITPIPLDRPPFPLAPGVLPPAYFTIQPGGAYLYNRTHSGARLIYPNTFGEPFAARHEGWHYDPGERGWYVYGYAGVTPDERQIVPYPGLELYEFTGAMLGCNHCFSPDKDTGGGPRVGEPVDASTGLFIMEKTDLVLPDVIPVVLTRTYRAADGRSRGFGKGATHPYDILLLGDSTAYSWADIILADGVRVHYVRITPGTDLYSAVLEHTATPTSFYKSRIAWNGNGWNLTLKDGTVYIFPDGFAASQPAQTALLRIQDRFGNTLRIHREASGNIKAITSPHGRSISFTYDTSFRITEARDSLGRTVGYTYDAMGRVWKVTDPAGGVTEYTYDTTHRMVTIKNPRGVVFLTNEYDANHRVIRQTQADGTTYQFAYTVDGANKVTQVEVTDPRGVARRVTFNASSYPLTDTQALGRSCQEVCK